MYFSVNIKIFIAELQFTYDNNQQKASKILIQSVQYEQSGHEYWRNDKGAICIGS